MTGLSANTEYFVRAYATNASGTSYGEEVSFTSGFVTGFDNADDAVFALYPNPATDGFTIDIYEKTSLVSIYDVSGSLLLEQQVAGKTYIDITSLQKGVYVVKVNGKVRKLVKK